MKSPIHLAFVLAAFALAGVLPASAALLTNTANYSPNLLIPDGSALGVADSHTFATAITTITEVRVTLEIAGDASNDGPLATPGAFNGDYYAYLTHSSGFAVLLNRAGRTVLNPFGYADSGFLVTFDDTPGSPDIHNYQLLNNPAGGELTGTWGSDGRNVNPATALETSPRTATLTSFTGLDPNGVWTLFVADVSPVGEGRLLSWQLEVTGNAVAASVPEPGSALAGLLTIGMVLANGRGRRRARG